MPGFSYFQPADRDLFYRSQKTGDPRMGEISLSFNEVDLKKGDFVLAGYPDDEGIALNQGRSGAKLAPDAIRSRFYKTSISEFHSNGFRLFDLGNLSTEIPLAARHEAGVEACEKVLLKKGKWIGLGGGHDYGYPDGAGFLRANRSSSLRPLIINFDAHLDVRPIDKGFSSGTPFYRLLTEEGLPHFDFMEVGLQRQCNSQSHIQWAKDKGAHLFFLEDLLASGQSLSTTLANVFAEWMVKPRPTFISMDIDCFSTAFAMGCSQSWPMGFTPHDVFPVLDILYRNLDVQALGVYEVSPPLDQDEATVKLATQLIYQFMGVKK